MNLDIVATQAPSPRDRDAVLNTLIDFNESRAGPLNFKEFALLLRDPENGEAVGGLCSYSFFDWFYIDLFAVPEKFRGAGLGTHLLQRAEAVARERGCIGIWLNTFSFQARGFYEKHGYEVFGTIDDHPRGKQRHFMQKRL